MRQGRMLQEAAELMVGIPFSFDNIAAPGRSRGGGGGKLFKRDSSSNLSRPYERQAHTAVCIAQMPFERNGSFVGRENTIKDIESKFLSKVHNRRVALYGLGGIG